MAAHVWAFPWLALLFGGAALLFAFLGGRPLLDGYRSRTLSAVPLALSWAVVIAALYLVARQVGDAAGIDVIPARGILLGALAGLALAALSRKIDDPRKAPLAVFGIATVSLAAARLWLTHGEVSGLTAVALSAAVTALMLRALPDPGMGAEGEAPSLPVAGSLYLATLAATIELGFTRAEQLSQMYWPDVTLLLSGIACLGFLITSALTRPALPDARRPVRPGAAVGAIAPVALMLISGIWLTAALIHDTTAIKVLAAGLALWIFFPLLQALATREPSAGDTQAQAGPERSYAGIAILLTVVAVGVSYNYWAGYGVGLLAIGGWTSLTAAGAMDTRAKRTAAADAGVGYELLTFGLLIMVRRLLVLQNDGFDGATDSWGLLALAAGACLPFALPFALPLSWPARRSGLVSFGSVILLAGTTLSIAYLFATQSLANVCVGVALAMLLTAVTILSPARRRIALLSGASVGLFLLLIAPAAVGWKEPTRRAKTELLGGLAVVAVIAQIAAVRPRRIQEA